MVKEVMERTPNSVMSSRYEKRLTTNVNFAHSAAVTLALSIFIRSPEIGDL